MKGYIDESTSRPAPGAVVDTSAKDEEIKKLNETIEKEKREKEEQEKLLNAEIDELQKELEELKALVEE